MKQVVCDACNGVEKDENNYVEMQIKRPHHAQVFYYDFCNICLTKKLGLVIQ